MRVTTYCSNCKQIQIMILEHKKEFPKDTYLICIACKTFNGVIN